MFSKVFIFAVFAAVNAGVLQPALRYEAPVVNYQPAPLVSYTSPAITKTEFIPESYSSSYRSDVITPRVKYTETPAVAVTIPQPTIAVAPVARFEHVAPIVPALPAIAPVHHSIAPVARFEHAAPIVPALPAIAPAHLSFAPVARIAHATALPAVAPAPLAFGHGSIGLHHGRVGFGLPAHFAHGFAGYPHGFVGHAGFGAPLARAYGY